LSILSAKKLENLLYELPDTAVSWICINEKYYKS
jgi:hypothetical protein